MPLDQKEREFFRQMHTDLYVLKKTVEYIQENNDTIVAPNDHDLEEFRNDARDVIDRLKTPIRE